MVQELDENADFLFKMVVSCLLISNYFALVLLLKERNPLFFLHPVVTLDVFMCILLLILIHAWLVLPLYKTLLEVLLTDCKYMKSHLSSVFCISLLIPSPNFLKSQGFAMLLNAAVISILLPHHYSLQLCLASYNGISLFCSRNITVKYDCM